MSKDSTMWKSMLGENEELKFSFNWYDDHSSWRLEELNDSIKEASELLASAGIMVETVNQVSELTPIVNHLKSLHRDSKIKDHEVRRALQLADELHFGDYLESEDANFSYECLIENIEEHFEAWVSAQTWVYTDSWSADPTREFAQCRESRYGLGDHWSITITDNYIDLPNGRRITGVKPVPMLENIFDSITENNNDEDDYPKLVEILIKVNSSKHQLLSETIDTFNQAGIEIFPVLLQEIVSILSNSNSLDFNSVLETFLSLSAEWHDGWADLLQTALVLEKESITKYEKILTV